MKHFLLIIATILCINSYGLSDSSQFARYFNTAIEARKTGDYQNSLINLFEAKKYCASSDDYLLAYSTIAGTYYKLTDFFLAKDYIDSSMYFLDSMKKYNSYIYNITGLIYTGLQKYDSALLYFHSALHFKNAEIGAIYNNIGRCFNLYEIQDSAIYYFQKAFYFNKAEYGINNYSTLKSGLELLDITRSIDLREELKQPIQDFGSPYLKGLFCSYTNQYEKAEELLAGNYYSLLKMYVNSHHYLKAVEMIDSLRTLYNPINGKLFLQANERLIYKQAIEQALQTDTTLALQIALKSRANLLREDLHIQTTKLPHAYSYFDFDSVIYLFRTNSKIQVSRIDVDSIFTANLKRFMVCLQIDSVANNYFKGFRDYCYTANYLYKKLIPDPQENMCIIPDGRIHYIPFEALLTELPDTSFPDYQVLPYLMNVSDIHYDYFLRSHTNTGNTIKAVLLAPDKTLKFSQKLANSLRLRFNVFTGNRATKNKIHNGNLLHIDAHYTPDNKFIKLADSLLYIDSIANLPKELVVIATCYSGIGKDYHGEGIYSPGRFFYRAGAKAVIESIWESDELSSYMILKEFYKSKPLSKSKSLTAAKQTYLSEGLNLHPFYWAHMRMFGNNLPVKIGFSNWLKALTGALTIVILLYYAVRFTRK